MNFDHVRVIDIENIKNSSTDELTRRYKKLLIKRKVNEGNLWFNQQCIKRKLIPNYVNLKCKSKCQSAEKAVRRAEIIWVKLEIKRYFKILNILNIHLKVIHSELTFRLHKIEFDLLDTKIRNFVNQNDLIKRKTLNKKLNLLETRNNITDNDQNPKVHTFYNRFKNLSNIEFTTHEINVINRGIKFCPKPIFTNKIKEILACEADINLRASTNQLERLKIVKLIQNLTTNRQNYNTSDKFDNSYIKSINNKIQSNNLISIKSDKGNSIVILSKDDYVQKVNDFLSTENLNILQKDPTSKFQIELKNKLNDCNSTLTNFEKTKLIYKNPQAPKFYGLIKIHKENMPIRPVVSYINAPNRKLAIKLNTIFRNYEYKSRYSIKNSLELISKLKDKPVASNYKLVSFDVSSMFSKIPPKECLPLIKNYLEKIKINHCEKSEILELFELCIKQNYFSFGNKFYIQNEGLPMGSPISPLLADIFMENIENQIFKSNESNSIIWWYRYVDDVIAGFNGSSRQLDKFLGFINNIHKNIKFTLEIENENKINFLDLTIKRTENNLEFSIYRKPTHTDSTIPNYSCHPYSQKLSAYHHAMIHRIFTIPLSETNLNKEIEVIKQIALSNGFDRNLINKLIEKKHYRFVINSIFPKEIKKEDKYISLTYFGNISDKISKIIKTENKNLKISFKSHQNLGNILFNAKEKTNNLLKSGIYKLSCCHCNAIYIGQTQRNFEIRYKEHLSAFKNKHPDKSHFAKHLIDNNHKLSTNSKLEILHICDHPRKLNYFEALEINKFVNNPNYNLVNEQIDILTSPLLNIFKQNSN